ncbi:MAG: methyltransferase, partial [Pseudomonadota bacterium]
RVDIRSGSFRSDPLPEGPDMISLVRVLYDHADDTVRGLLAAVYKALPPGGRIVISEPMRGSSGPERPGDTYFAFYCMAMQTGRARSPQEIGELLGQAGFESIHHIPTHRPFVTSVITAER